MAALARRNLDLGSATGLVSGYLVEGDGIVYLVDLGQILDFWSVKHPQCQADHLQVFTACGGRDVSRLRANIIYNGFLEPGDQEVCALVHDLILYTGYPVEDDGPCATSNIIECCLAK